MYPSMMSSSQSAGPEPGESQLQVHHVAISHPVLAAPQQPCAWPPSAYGTNRLLLPRLLPAPNHHRKAPTSPIPLRPIRGHVHLH